MSKKGILVAAVLLVLSTFSAHYYDIIDLPILPSNFKSNFVKPIPDFEISADPKTIILGSLSGSSNSTIITIRSLNSFNKDITLVVDCAHASIFGIVDDVKFALAPSHVVLPVNGQEQSTLTIRVNSFISPGNYYIDVIGVAGEIKHTVRIRLIVVN